MTQEEFAKILGIATETLRKWEEGESIQPRAMDNMLKLFLKGNSDDATISVHSYDKTQKINLV